jgi:DNA-binding NarL/FixJ family response regulator
MAKTRVVLADDHPVFNRGLRILLEGESDDVKVLGTFTNGLGVLEFLKSEDADVAVLDARMPGMDGPATVQALKDGHPAVKTVILTTFGDASTIRSCLAAGADGLVLKDAPVSEILDAIRQVRQGRRYLSEPALRTLYESDENASKSDNAQARVNSLTIRQQEVLHLIAQGKRNSEIAEILHIGERTVRNYVSEIYDIIGVASRGEAVFWARECGIF